jgi:precorrin-8X/cobalt-precorrin-8 methylmutase
MIYLKSPSDIYQRSFAIIDAEVDFTDFNPRAIPVARRIVHSCGMVDVVSDLVISPDFSSRVESAVTLGSAIVVDAEMVRHGLIKSGLRDAKVHCFVSGETVERIAAENGTTRSAAAVKLWEPYLSGAVVVIGNAPTALYALLELLQAGGPRPAAIAAFPVGFVGAAESKQSLLDSGFDIPFATIRGRRGGSAMAAAAINACLLHQ